MLLRIKIAPDEAPAIAETGRHCYITQSAVKNGTRPPDDAMVTQQSDHMMHQPDDSTHFARLRGKPRERIAGTYTV